MSIEEIKADEFNEFANNHMLKNFYQTKEYGELMSHSDFSVAYIGAFFKGKIVAASLILYKSIGPSMKYGYAPRGFLLDYYDEELVQTFTKKIKEYFFMRGFVFIKINPEISYSVLNFNDKSKTIIAKNKEVISNLKKYGYDKLRDNIYFESLLPKYTPVINLQTYDFNVLDKKIIDEMKQDELKGVHLVQGHNDEDVKTFYKYIENKDNKTETYYKYFYNIFNKSNMVDLVLLEINYDSYAKFLQKQYLFEQENNEKINKNFEDNPKDINCYNKKVESDKILNSISYDIGLANQRMENNVLKEVLGGAFVIKHQGRITILIAGYNKDYNDIDARTFLFYKIIEEYKKAGYLFLDMNGITADFTESNPYKELNEFKLKFKPTVYEYIGEFDLIINKPLHQLLWSTNKIQKEFYKPAIKNS